MPAIIPAIVGVVVGELAGYVVGALASAAASAAIAKREQVRASRRALAQYNANLRDQTITVRGGVNPRPIIYGRTAVGGQLIYAESFGASKEHLVLVIALAHGECDAIETVYFNDVALTIDGANQVTSEPYAFAQDNYYQTNVTVPGSPYQVALAGTPLAGVTIQDVTNGTGGGDGGSPPILQAGTDYTLAGTTVTFAASLTGRTVQISYSTAGTSQSYAAVWRFTGAAGQDLSTTMLALGAPSWTAADKCQGMACLIVRMTYAENVWPSGIPNVKAVLRGRKVFDPRTSNTVYSNNAALCARDYLTFQYGVNAAGGKIDDTATISAANVCDEDVQLTATPTYQDRYTANGVINTGDDRLTNLGLLAESMAGSINYSQGKWRIRAGAYTVPALTLDESKLAGDSVQIVPYASRRSLINGAKATYINGDEAYIEDQAPEWSSSTFIADDGGAPLIKAIVLPLVTDHARAQRLSKIEVNRSREQLTLSCRCNFTTYTWQVGDMVSVTLARYGFSAKPFRIIERGFSVEGGMSFTLREEPNGLYDWNLGEASVLTGAGNTTLPNPAVVGVPTITGITSAQWLYKAGDGTFVARIRVAVTPPADEYVLKGGKLQLQYKRGDWTQDWALVEAAGDATQIWIDPAFDAQNYVIRVRAVNSAGFASAWSPMQSHTCQGRPGQVVNLLRNSNWAEDLGYAVDAAFSDTRTLRHWSPGGNPALFARNYNGGKVYNVGAGGCYVYIPSNTVGHYATIHQDVPVAAGAEFEASVYVYIARANVIFYLRFLNEAKDTALLDVTDVRNTGAEIVGDPYKPLSNPRLWCKGTAPENTAYARIICLVECTASSSPYPFTAWSNALLCIAPSGVTRDTATPWVADELSTIDGGIIAPGSVTDVLSDNPADGSFAWVNANPGLTPSYTSTIATVTYTNSTPQMIPAVVVYSALVSWVNSGLQAGGARLKTNLNGSITVPTALDIFSTNESTPTRELIAGTFSIDVPAGQFLTVTLEMFGARFAPGVNTTTAYFKNAQLNFQGIRK